MIVEHLLWSQLNQIIHSTYIWPPVLIKVIRYSSLAKLAPDYRMCLQDAVLSQIFIQTWDFLVSVFTLGWEALLFLQGFSLPLLLSFPPKRMRAMYSFHLTCCSWNIIALILFSQLILLLLIPDYKPVESYERYLSEPGLQLLSRPYIKISRNFPGEEMGNWTF